MHFSSKSKLKYQIRPFLQQLKTGTIFSDVNVQHSTSVTFLLIYTNAVILQCHLYCRVLVALDTVASKLSETSSG